MKKRRIEMMIRGLLMAALSLAACDTADEGSPVANAPSREGQLCAPGFHEQPFVAGQNTGYEVAGQTRSFYLQLPDPEHFSGPRPVVFCFHGTNGSGLIGFDKYELTQFVEAGFIVIAPDSNQNGEIWPVWDAMHSPGNVPEINPDLALFDSLMSCLPTHHDVDPTRLFVVGMSAGGIMVNYVLQRRSELLAGGVVASGIFDLTSPEPMPDIGEMAIMVTWGGSNDAWGGDANDNVEVADVNFVEQAAAASQFWEGFSTIQQIHCMGDELGHTWLIDANPLIIDFFLAHPKGSADAGQWNLPEDEDSWQASCSEDAAVFVPEIQVVCEESTTPLCQSACQFMVDCVVENATVAPVLGPQMASMGFEGDPPVCDDCLTYCEADVSAGGSDEATVLACFEEASQNVVCGGGIQGALPYIDTINLCCEDRQESPYCTRLCEALLANDIASQFVPTCEAWAD